MENVLVLVAVEEDGSIAKSAREAVAAGKKLAAELSSAFCVGLFGSDSAAGANELANCGAAKFLGVAGEAFAKPRYATDAAAAEELAKASEASIVVAPATSRISRIAAGVAHRLGGRVDSRVTAIDVENGAPVATRWYYRQRLVTRLGRTQRPWFLTIDPGSTEPWAGEPGQAAVEPLTAATGSRTAVEGVKVPEVAQQTIRPEADVLLVAGAGWCKKQSDGQIHVAEAEEAILTFLNKTKASLGSSKSLVDQAGEGQAVISFLTHLNQVGQTGSTPRHPKGLATCCHGEEPHVVGWRFINERRAVNLDANCGWAQGKADVLYVADAFEVMKKLNALL